MKRYLLTFIILSTTLVLQAQQPAVSKLSGWIRQKLAQPTTRRAASEDPVLMTTFLRTTDEMTDEMLQGYDCKVYARLGDICIVTIPKDRLAELSQHPQVLRIEASPSAHVTMDEVPTQVNALPAYQQTPQHEAYTGKGVVVGVMDIGFDLTHPTFFNDATLSQYRIKTFWDQLAASDDVSRFPVGREYVGTEQILAVGCATDGKTQNHGTHTTGIAAGSGYDTNYRGIAYESDIALVANAVTADTLYINKDDYYKYTSATDALGFKYLFDYAQQQGKPCVASFSEGYTPYMDDDDLLYSEFLERLTGPGRILVASAGNESLNATYFEKPNGVEEAGAFLLLFKKQGLYRLLTDGNPTLTVRHYNDRQEEDKQLSMVMNSEAWEKGTLVDTLFIGQDTLAINITAHTSSLISEQTMYMVTLTSNLSINRLGEIAITTAGSDCRTEVFGSSTYSLKSSDVDTRWNAAQKGHNILSPGGLSAPICVGSTSHRMEFVNIHGKTISHSYGESPGQWSPFSSTGPTMGGLLKPDVAAPGLNVLASMSSYYLEEHPVDENPDTWDVAHFEVNGRTYPWTSNSGTSMSTPVVAGAIALWLEAKPTLTKDDIMGILERTCRHPEADLTYPNNRYGYGEIDVYRGLLDILGVTGIKEISQHHPQTVSISFKDGLLHLQFSELPQQPVTLSIYSTGGVLHYQQRLSVKQQEITLPLPIKGKGVYVVQLTGEPSVAGSQLIRR